MPDGVRILNFARKELVAENDIIEALGTGKCAAYVTDFRQTLSFALTA
jgi:D-3-phosphoglycerate dehydrogenase